MKIKKFVALGIITLFLLSICTIGFGSYQIKERVEEESQLDYSVLNDNAEVDYVVIYPQEDDTISAGEELEFDAEAYDEDDNPITDDVEDFEWENTKPRGVFYKEDTGEYEVTASYEGVTSPVTNVTVEPAEAVEFWIGPEEEKFTAGESRGYSAWGEDEYGNEFEVTAETSWADTVEPAEASEWVGNEITVTEPGTWEIIGEYENEIGETLTSTAKLEVVFADVDYIEIYPEEDQEVKAGEELEFDAWVYDAEDNLITDDAEDFEWENTKPRGVFYKESPGEYEVWASYEGVKSPVTNVTVEPAEANYIEILPENSTITAGETENYTATAYDEFGNEIGNVTDETEWSIDEDAGGDWNQNIGVYTSEFKGEWIVEGEYDGIVNTTSLTVEPAEAADFEFDTIEEEQIAGEPFEITITAYDRYDNLAKGYEGIAVLEDTTGTIDPVETDAFDEGVWTGEVTITDADENIEITAEDEDITGTSNEFNIEPAEMEYIEVSPEDSTITAGETESYLATAYDEFGNEIGDVTEETVWSIDEEAGGEWDQTTGVYTSEFAGVWTVEGEYDGIVNTTSLTVEPAEAIEIWIEPEEVNITAGESQEYTAMGEDEYGNQFDVTDDTNWSDDVEPLETSEWVGNEVTITESGTWEITAEYENETATLTNTSTLHVHPAEADYFEFEQIGDQVAGESFEITITAYDEYDNLATGYENTAELEDTTGTIDSIETGAFTEGLWTGEVTITEADENVAITAEDEDITGTSGEFMVEPAEIDYIEVSPEDSTITAGETESYSATAYDEFGNEIEDVTGETQWSDNIDDSEWEDNEITAYTAGEDWEITGEYDGFDDVVTLTVEPADVDRVLIQPEEDQTIEAGDTVEFSAEAYDEYDNLITDDDTDFTWQNTDDTGLFDETEAGDYEVTATYDGVESEPTTVTVEEEEEEDEEDGLIPGFTTVLVLLAMVMAVAIYHKKKL